MFIMRILKLLWVWINILTPEELHQFVDLLDKGRDEFIVEGSHAIVNFFCPGGAFYPPRLIGTESEW